MSDDEKKPFDKKAYYKRYYREHREKLLAYQKAYRARQTPEQRRALRRARVYTEEQRAVRRAHNRAYLRIKRPPQTPEQKETKRLERERTASERKAAQMARAKKREAERTYTEKERAYRRAYQKAYNASAHGKATIAARAARPEKRVAKAAQRKAYRQSEKGRQKERERGIAKAHRRRVMLGQPLSSKVVASVCSARVCYYCGVGIEPMRGVRGHACKTTLDHRVPVARGGTNEPENLVGACLDCNSRKRDLTDLEFLARV